MKIQSTPKSVIISSFLAFHPTRLVPQNQIAKYEGYYASVFYCYFTALGLDVTAEDTTNNGRIDLTVKLERRVFILEFKVVDMNTGKNSALKQIKEKACNRSLPPPFFSFVLEKILTKIRYSILYRS